MNDFLDGRRKALETSFFVQRDQELLAELRKDMTKESLAELSGVSDAALLDRLIELGVSAETLAALSLAPLVAVAWADGSIAENERDAILRSADEAGLSKGHEAYGLLVNWLEEKPPADFISAWKEYSTELAQQLDDAGRQRLSETVLGRARAVAEAAGGILGMGAISPAEKAVLADLESALA
ncbi:MAG: hypothetical protein QGG36_02790 [Pirellulaceae bacterium]|jgi:hypothetical protein|nr:hypothetical protein [Pirellulaceae bacterium]MDP7014705.1 hypothetical protein [Pirellulaceae bacterium]